MPEKRLERTRAAYRDDVPPFPFKPTHLYDHDFAAEPLEVGRVVTVPRRLWLGDAE